MNDFIPVSARHGIMGGVFGLIFPLVAWKTSDPFILYSIICTAPFFLGLMAYLVGVKQRTLKEVAESEIQFYREALDRTAIVAVTDSRGVILYVNEAFVRISGYSKEELIGQTHRIVRSDIMGKGFFKELWETISSGKIWRGEICNKAKNGELYWVDTTIIPTADALGRIIRYTAIRHEITARKRMEKELWESNEMQRAILASTNNILISFDPEGVIQTFNAFAEKMFGFVSNEVVGKKNIVDFFDKNEIQLCAEKLSAELKRKISYGFEVFVAQSRTDQLVEHEWTCFTKDGAAFPVSLTVTGLYDNKGNSVGFLGSAHDISVSKRISEELIASKESAVAAMEAKSTFLANLSHEIRTPMNGIIGMTNLLLGSTSDPKIFDRLKIIQNCGNTLLDLINDILDFSKLEAGRVELEYNPFPLHRTIHETIELLERRAEEKHIRLQYTYDKNVPEWISGDITRFRQILMNLLVNAIKFTHVGGVTINTKARRLDEDNWEIQCSVKDTGIGIAPELQHRLFLSFSQVDASTTRRFGGTGLGLAICKGLCEKMGGTIWLESQEGKGSVFHFTFHGEECDSLASDRSEPFSESLVNAKSHPLRILLAEDNRTNQIVALGMLEQLGYRCDVAANGKEVLECLERQNYDLIFMDYHMPVMDGIEATKRIIQDFGGRRRPRIIALTASVMKEDIELCLNSGMDGVIGKPVALEDLVNALNGTSSFSGEEMAVKVDGNLSANEVREIFQKKKFLDRFKGFEDVAMETAETFVKAASDMLSKIEEALRKSDLSALEISAHTLKGAVSNFYAGPSTKLAAKLEAMAKNNEIQGADVVCTELAFEVKRLVAALTDVVSRVEKKIA